MQISSMAVQKDDRLQLLVQTLSLHSGLDASHHLHRLKLRWLTDWTPAGRPEVGTQRTRGREDERQQDTRSEQQQEVPSYNKWKLVVL